jgi:hypothetical protein
MSLWAKALIALGVLVLIVAGLWWWLNRPIRPVLLSSEEKALVETKIQAIQKPAEAAVATP